MNLNIVKDAIDTGKIMLSTWRTQATAGEKLMAGTGFVLGAIGGAPHGFGGMIWSGLKEGAIAWGLGRFFPAFTAFQMGMGIAEMAMGLPRTMGQMSSQITGMQVAAGERQYHPVELPRVDPYGGNLRKRALGHMISSRQNNKSFIGNEASSMHDY
jgi:hypothetical protein